MHNYTFVTWRHSLVWTWHLKKKNIIWWTRHRFCLSSDIMLSLSNEYVVDHNHKVISKTDGWCTFDISVFGINFCRRSSGYCFWKMVLFGYACIEILFPSSIKKTSTIYFYLHQLLFFFYLNNYISNTDISRRYYISLSI